MNRLRVFLLALLVNAPLLPQGVSDPCLERADEGSTPEGSLHGASTGEAATQECGSFADLCACCSDVSETAMVPKDHALLLAFEPQRFLSAGPPVTDGYAPAPFRPPIAS